MIGFRRTPPKFLVDRKPFSSKQASQSIGYLRVNSSQPIVSDNLQPFKSAGCCLIFKEEINARNKSRSCPELQKALSKLRSGDELVIEKLGCLGGSQAEVISLINELQSKGIHIRTLNGLVNTKNLGELAPLLIGLLQSLTEIDKSIIQERSRESINFRRENGGNLGGRPKINQAREKLVLRLREEGASYRSIRSQTSLALSTIRRIILEDEALKVYSREKHQPENE